MKTSTPAPTCPTCGKTITPDFPGGWCPPCLLLQVIFHVPFNDCTSGDDIPSSSLAQAISADETANPPGAAI